MQAPKKYSTVFADIARGNRGFVPIHATCGKTTWDTSLLPKGDGTHFIALPKHVRRAENILLGDTQTIRFTLRI